MEPSGERADLAQLAAQVEPFVAAHVRAQLTASAPTGAAGAAGVDGAALLDERATEDLLYQAYAAAGIDHPRHLHWFDGPLELVAVLARENADISVDEPYVERVPHCVWDDALLDHDELTKHVRAGVDYRIRQLSEMAWRQVNTDLKTSRLEDLKRVVRSQVSRLCWNPLQILVADRLWRALGDAAGAPISRWVRVGNWYSQEVSLWHSVSAYDAATDLIELLFYDTYLAPNAAGALARFNEAVSGYWLGKAMALLVRKPLLLARDEEGRLHSATGPCIRYRDGWEVYAWHGVRVSANVILQSAESFTRDDFFNTPNLEVRRVIQERMGERFIWEIGARFVNSGARGILYEVDLPDDPDRVARYLQVTDPSTGRVYYLRVPPDTQTAAAAAAWTFGLTVDEYAPLRES